MLLTPDWNPSPVNVATPFTDVAVTDVTGDPSDCSTDAVAAEIVTTWPVSVLFPLESRS